MIIDEIIETKELKKALNIKYIEEQAENFGFYYILKPIKEKNEEELKKALKKYLKQANYNYSLSKDIDNLKISFADQEELKSIIFEEIETSLFLNNELLEIVGDIFEDIEQADYNEFVYNFNFKISFDYEDRIKFLIFKDYCTFDNLKKAEWETIKKDFLNDIFDCFVKCGGQ